MYFNVGKELVTQNFGQRSKGNMKLCPPFFKRTLLTVKVPYTTTLVFKSKTLPKGGLSLKTCGRSALERVLETNTRL